MSTRATSRRKNRSARIVIADDHDLTRIGLRSLIQDERGLDLVGEARNGHEALQLCRRLEPDLVILDIRMPLLDGLAATRAIKQDYPRIAVLLVSFHATPEYILEALESGASGYVLKDAPFAELLDVIHKILYGESLLTEALAAQMLRRLNKRPDAIVAPLRDPLTPREFEVLRLVAQGKTNRSIGEQLFITTGTVKLHVEHIIAKLDVSDRTQAAVRAIRLGLLSHETEQNA
jgi:DNA-binding NarL/FixJ family response regulator